MAKFVEQRDARYDVASRTWHYEVVALSIPIIFNPSRDHDPNGMMYALASHRPELERLAARYRELLEGSHTLAELREFSTHPLVRPLVLRARAGDTVMVRFTNHVHGRCVGLHLVGPGVNASSDGAQVLDNPRSVSCAQSAGVSCAQSAGVSCAQSAGVSCAQSAGVSCAQSAGPNTVTYTWRCEHEGTFPFHDLADPDGDETGSNAHGLFGALIVEPPNAWWTDPRRDGLVPVADGLYVDVHRRSEHELTSPGLRRAPFPGEKTGRPPRHAHPRASFREYVLLFHDEPEWDELIGKDELIPANPCPLRHHDAPAECPKAKPGEPFPLASGEEHAPPSLMLFNYRTEPMKNRERVLWRKLYQNELRETVINEEQHHSSWLFGDPATPVLEAYVGDPVRIRLLHAGVKETHVFHLHVYSWYADANNPRSPVIDAVSISPQTGHTIVPLYGAGNAQAVPGDVIWHCHLYPHFHMGMWGMLRSFDTLQTGELGPVLASTGVYAGRRIGEYPDGTPIARLAVLPDREPPPSPTRERPGYPLFIAGTFGQKSPRVPWPLSTPIPASWDYREAEPLELAAMNSAPKPGEMFTRIPHPEHKTWWVDTNGDGAVDRLRRAASPAGVDHAIAVGRGRIEYNRSASWHDPDGHFFYLADGADPFDTPKPEEPLFFRARAGEVLNLTFSNAIGFRKPRGPVHAESEEHIPAPTEGQLEWMYYDLNIPPCDCLLVPGEQRPGAECGLHVHIVKFDPICADGASVGWNYMSAPRDGKQLVYRWWCDEEFGTIFFHDHLFANTRQRHGLFGALIVEPARSRFLDPWQRDKEIVAGAQAVIEVGGGQRFREFCVGLADWVAMYKETGESPDGIEPLEPPHVPSGHDDNGTMAVNYRCEPLRERGPEPHRWFSSSVREPETPIFHTHAGEPIRLRLVQGSHEEQHSFQVHGLRWNAFRKDRRSPLQNQRTLGISEAFTFDIDTEYGPGDYLWRLAGVDDTWLGCWGYIRAHGAPGSEGAPWPIQPCDTDEPEPAPPERERRRFRVKAVQRRIEYRTGDAQRSRLIDPKGLAFIVTAMARPGSDRYEPITEADEPLVLRCRSGEWVQIELYNALPSTGLTPERHPPEMPVAGEFPYPVSNRVSLHTDLLSYDVRRSDGAWVGKNPDQTLAPGQTKTYVLHADVEPGPVLLQDMADVRNHRRHGLFGALVVEPHDWTPLAVQPGAPSAPRGELHELARAWTGARATLLDRRTLARTEEMVLLLHDGVRYYVDGVENDGPTPNPPDIPGDVEEAPHAEGVAGQGDADAHGPGDNIEGPDPEDQGHKAFNYRSERIDRAFTPNVSLAAPLYRFPDPATPVVHVPANADVIVRFVCAADKPRNHAFTIHGHAWREWPHRGSESPVVSSEAALSSGSVRSYRFRANAEPGDYLYRSGVLKWTVAQGAWGILRVHGR